MNTPTALTRTLATIACLAAAAPINAHEFWIDPDPFHPEQGQDLSADLRVGQGLSGNALAYLDTTIAAMTLHTPRGARTIDSRTGDIPAISNLTMQGQGLHILTAETHPAYIVFDRMPEFKEYLAYEGLSDVATAHNERGLPDTAIAEEYLRNARALVQVGSVSPEDMDRPTGMPFELIFVGSPFAAQATSFVLRLEWQGAVAPGVQVAMFHVPNGGAAPDDTVRTVATTNQDGIVEFANAGTGQYLLNAVRMDPVSGPGSVVWQSHWASLTFHIKQPQ